MKKIAVSTSKPYEIIIAAGLLDSAGEIASHIVKGATAAIVTDDIVDALYGARLSSSLDNAGFKTVKFVIKNGEASKNADNYIALLNFLAQAQLTRADVIFALGGGVVGDLAGFAASTYMRGIRLVQLPTTLLAAVDSSVGGKTGIDLPSGKNLAGTLYQPDLVLCDYTLLDTLSKDTFLDGLAEVVKYGVIAGGALFGTLKSPILPQLGEIIERCVTIKRDIVVADEKESGIRKLLNLGHTVGHAIEACSGYSISHGKAVAVGMAVMTRACLKAGLCSAETCNEIVGMIQSLGLPVATAYSAEELARAALSDKKRSGGVITLAIPKAVGECVLYDIATEGFLDFIRPGLETTEN